MKREKEGKRKGQEKNVKKWKGKSKKRNLLFLLLSTSLRKSCKLELPS